MRSVAVVFALASVVLRESGLLFGAIPVPGPVSSVSLSRFFSPALPLNRYFVP